MCFPDHWESSCLPWHCLILFSSSVLSREGVVLCFKPLKCLETPHELWDLVAAGEKEPCREGETGVRIPHPSGREGPAQLLSFQMDPAGCLLGDVLGGLLYQPDHLGTGQAFPSPIKAGISR